ncbi:hypothetical protein P691DRAFT_802014, partial [Macrolepiota fuliginosa MF-IS2]
MGPMIQVYFVAKFLFSFLSCFGASTAKKLRRGALYPGGSYELKMHVFREGVLPDMKTLTDRCAVLRYEPFGNKFAV